MIAVADQLGKVGVKAKVQILEWGVFSDIIRAKANGESFLIGWYDHGDAELSLMHAMSGSPYAFWANKEFDALMAQGRSTLDQQKREQLYWKATALMHDDPPGIFLLSLPALYGVSSRVENYKPEPSERFNFFPARLKP
ncbi:MAG: hypothetical protein HYU43_07060 [Armatimonadetes bacterium]|nr:hypothetical protein [Armatimonadota bacterium]